MLSVKFLDGLRAALTAGRDILERGGTCTDAVVAALTSLEDNPSFNAGRGASYNQAGVHELDAAIMDGRDYRCGAVAGVKRVKNPIRLAQRIKEDMQYIQSGREFTPITTHAPSPVPEPGKSSCATWRPTAYTAS